MIVTYLTADNSLVSVAHVGHLADGRAKWQVRVEGAGGAASWGTGDFPAPPAWSAEQVARNALQWALGISDDSCRCHCPDPECPGKNFTAADIFGATEPHTVELHGPYFDRHEAVIAASVQSGLLDPDDVPELEPPLEDILAQLDGKPKQVKPPTRPSDPYDGNTWKLG